MDPVETARLKELIELMDRNQLEELEVVEGDTRIRLRKKPERSAEVVSMTTIPAMSVPGAVPVDAAASAGKSDPEPVLDESNMVRSPMVGTFYRSPGPGVEAFVETGDQVEEGQVLCIVEAMKVMNEVKADRSGTIASVLIDDGSPVEFGQLLFSFS
ncbi:MAG TPA: acetyl-CoA carboxylase biotin carboxyl carrier protein [Planctomycetes bacterium]|nr:acetyl-CoA carboxylase biotin carboxyl carrier protein [Planctomycetota bacterium]